MTPSWNLSPANQPKSRAGISEKRSASSPRSTCPTSASTTALTAGSHATTPSCAPPSTPSKSCAKPAICTTKASATFSSLRASIPKFVSDGYLQDIVRKLAPLFPTIGIEVGPMEDHQYAELVKAGAEGLIVYQETYHRDTYKTLHTAGPKKEFRLALGMP